jgi:hypothetical protein
MKSKIFNKKIEEKSSHSYLKEVKGRNSKGKLEIEKLSGSIPNLNMDPESFRKEIWTRKKSEF